MQNKIQTLVVLMFVLRTSLMSAQQHAQYTQYMYNTITVNPAYAGSRGTFSTQLLHRSQWAGLDGAPVTQTFSLHSPIGSSEKVGLGASVINDKLGPTNQTTFDIDFSYSINVNENGRLAFGLKAGGHLLDVNFDELNAYSNSDVFLENNIDNRFSPNFGVGLYYHTKKYYLGLSVPKLLQTKHFDGSQNTSQGFVSSLAKERVHYYAMAGYVYDINEDFKLKPTVLAKVVSGAPFQVDFSANVLYKEKLTFGLAYRLSADISGMIGYQLTDDFLVGVAYDRVVTDFGNVDFNNNSFEFILRYEVFKKDKLISPRFF